jgi:hypothetical protein
MRRSVAITWHASFFVLSAALYFFFVLPRWFELTGQTSHTLGTAARIVCGLLVALSALPVLLTLQRTRRPEYRTPQLALSLRTASIVLHVLGGALILGVGVSEIWLTLDQAGPWLFGLYGAAAGVTLLAVLAFYLAFLAEVPPPAPKPIKVKKTGRVEAATVEPDVPETETDNEAGGADETDDGNETEPASEETDAEAAEEAPAGKLRNRRSGRGLFGRSGGGA